MYYKDYNTYLESIKAANDCEPSVARELLRKIQAQMIAQYGPGEDDVQYLLRQFRYNI